MRLPVNDEEINFRSTWFIGVQISQCRLTPTWSGRLDTK